MPNVPPPPPPPAIVQQMPAPQQMTNTVSFGQASTTRAVQPVSSYIVAKVNKPFRILNQRQKRLRDRRIGHNRLRKK